jgi:hypothetical protein
VDQVWRQVPDGIASDLRINLDPKCYGLFRDANGRCVRHIAFVDRQGRLAFADRPQDAPVVHFGGSLTPHLRPSEKIRRGQHPEELNFWLGTPGLRAGTFAIMSYDLVPGDVHPVVEVQFPAKERDQKPITRKYTFSRC